MMINERLYWKAAKYAEWRCVHVDRETEETHCDFPELHKVLFEEYKRLLKIEEALQGLADDAQQLNLGY